MVIYYNTQNIPKQDYRIVSHLMGSDGWTSKKMMEQAMYPWKNVQSDRKVSSYEIEGEDGRRYQVDADVLLKGMLHHTISIINGRVYGYEIQYDPYVDFE